MVASPMRQAARGALLRERLGRRGASWRRAGAAASPARQGHSRSRRVKCTSSSLPPDESGDGGTSAAGESATPSDRTPSACSTGGSPRPPLGSASLPPDDQGPSGTTAVTKVTAPSGQVPDACSARAPCPPRPPLGKASLPPDDSVPSETPAVTKVTTPSDQVLNACSAGAPCPPPPPPPLALASLSPNESALSGTSAATSVTTPSDQVPIACPAGASGPPLPAAKITMRSMPRRAYLKRRQSRSRRYRTALGWPPLLRAEPRRGYLRLGLGVLETSTGPARPRSWPARSLGPAVGTPAPLLVRVHDLHLARESRALPPGDQRLGGRLPPHAAQLLRVRGRTCSLFFRREGLRRLYLWPGPSEGAGRDTGCI